MKAAYLYAGGDNYSQEYALRTDGQWFCRFYQYNGFGMAWTKWEKCMSNPFTPLKLKNTMADDYDWAEEHVKNNGEYILSGATRAKIISDKPKVRLPNA